MTTSFPTQPDGVAWPTRTWERGELGSTVDAAQLATALDALYADQAGPVGATLATVVVQGGRIVTERYGDDTDETSGMLSWSMAKSVIDAVIGLLVGDGALDVRAPALVPEWSELDDPRRAITVEHLLGMRSGLRFVEDYVDDATSHCLDMLFGSGKDDVAHYAASLPLDHTPGEVWSYSSGTTNILSRLSGDLIGGGEAGMRSFLADRLFGPIGMASASPGFDAAGTFVGSSFLWCTAQDFARFGLLYAREGCWDGRQLLPAGWVQHARAPVPVEVVDDQPGFGYGSQWWLWPDRPGTFCAKGYEGQRIIVSPERDLVVVRLGKTPAVDKQPLDQLLDDVLDSFPVILPAARLG
jgi:CubicO group peptidase (beta-lactamase class C family)